METGTAVRLPRFGLAVKLATSVVAAALLGFFLFGYMHQRLDQRHLETLVSLSAERIVDLIHSSAWEAMLNNDRERLYTLLRDIGREPGIRLVRIINEDGLVRHSTRQSEVGTMVDKTGEACYGCHAQSQPLTKIARSDRARIFSDEHGRRTLAVIRPIENQPECSNAACHAHPASRRILGVIDAHLSLDAVDAQLAEHRQQMLVFTMVAALIACVLSVVFVYVVVHRPMRELLRATIQLGHGEMSTRLRRRSHDEFGVLADSFNSMAAELDSAHKELQKWAHTLEDRVHQKTSELEKAHRTLLASEKMASLGRLAATVAHEVNNPLFGMLTYARLTLKDIDKLDLPPEARARVSEHLGIIERESRRCGDLMKNLLAFARQKPPQRAPMQVNAVVEDAIRLVAHQYELAQTVLERELAPDLPDLMGDAAQIQQVLIVLLVNAGEALGKGGIVRISTGRAGQGVRIAVADNGPGIPPDLQERIFEPFFTTKDNQHRTGLGLAVAHTIVERHGGSLTVHSVPGDGAEFVVQLPIEAPATLVAAETQGEQTR